MGSCLWEDQLIKAPVPSLVVKRKVMDQQRCLVGLLLWQEGMHSAD
jgi:hypothetical protein